jgi:calcineurin-like phosphoesterase family protein
MNETIIQNWNSVVGADDTVIHAGDVGFGLAGLNCVRRLNGRKILIRGNHDYRHKRHILEQVGFEFVYDDAHLFRFPEFGGVQFLVSHYPLDVPDRIPCFCGHVHNRWERRGKWVNVGVDVHNFTPMLVKFVG